MASINVTGVQVLDNPAAFTNALQFEISFECLSPIEDDVEWKLTYVGSADSEVHDQELDSVLVGPITPGAYKIVFQAPAPDHTQIPPDDLLGVTVIILSCLYRDKEFVRIGYYVNNEYDDPELRDNPPDVVDISRVRREVLADKPRVTRYDINWGAPLAPEGAQEVPTEEAPPTPIAGGASAVPDAPTPIVEGASALQDAPTTIGGEYATAPATGCMAAAPDPAPMGTAMLMG